MTIQLQRIDEVLDWIEQHQDQWDQAAWCMPKNDDDESDWGKDKKDLRNSTFCFAGTACLLYDRIGFAASFGGKKAVAYDNNGGIAKFADVARELLGLDRETATLIFYIRGGDFAFFKAQVHAIVSMAITEEAMNELLDPASVPALPDRRAPGHLPMRATDRHRPA